MRSPSLHKQIAQLLREGASRAATPAAAQVGEATDAPPPARQVILVPAVPEGASVEEAFAGYAHATDDGAVWVIERRLSDFLPHADSLLRKYRRVFHLHGDWLRTNDAKGDLYQLFAGAPDSALFFDLETTGLSSATPIFLVGTLRCTGDDFLIAQFFARDYAEEKPMLQAFAELATRHSSLVTFNGKSFDLPYVRERMVYHRLDADLSHHHVDLLHHARRWFRGRLANCKLQTLEYHLCRRARVDDAPSSEIPATYHEFVRTQNVGLLAPVIHHNALDVVTMLEVLLGLTERAGGVEEA